MSPFVNILKITVQLGLTTIRRRITLIQCLKLNLLHRLHPLNKKYRCLTYLTKERRCHNSLIRCNSSNRKLWVSIKELAHSLRVSIELFSILHDFKATLIVTSSRVRLERVALVGRTFHVVS